MANSLNPFQGLGRIESYIRWNRFRGVSWQQARARALKKFGNRFGKQISQRISEAKMKESTASAFNRSGENIDISDLSLPLGQRRSTNVRMSGRISFRSPWEVRGKRQTERLFTFDVPKTGSKKSILRSLREQILDAFFSHYDIANKYKPDFRRRFGDIDITDIEGI